LGEIVTVSMALLSINESYDDYRIDLAAGQTRGGKSLGKTQSPD